MSIELYVFPSSPRSFKVTAVANHLGLDIAGRAHYPVEPYGEIRRWYSALRELPAAEDAGTSRAAGLRYSAEERSERRAPWD
jgi:hypothetical protein